MLNEVAVGGACASWQRRALWLVLLLVVGTWAGLARERLQEFLPDLHGLVFHLALILVLVAIVLRPQSLVRWTQFGSDRRWLIALTAIALALRVTWVMIGSTAPTSDYLTYQNLATTLAHDGYFGSEGVPSAFRPVGWPAFMALLARMDLDLRIAGGISNAVFMAATVPAVYLWVLPAGGALAARVAAMALAASPSQILYSSVLGSEPLFTLLLMGGLVLWSRSRESDSVCFACVAGLLFGLAAYVRSHALVFPVALGAVALLRKRPSLRSLSIFAVVVATSLVVLVPWGIRNAVTLGEFSLTTTNGGVTLFLANNDHANGKYKWRAEWDSQLPSGELERNHVARALAVNWIASHPAEFAKLVSRKWSEAFGSESDSVWWAITAEHWKPWRVLLNEVVHGYLLLLLGVACIGAIRVRTLGWNIGLEMMAVVLSLWFGIHAVFQGQPRFHYPMLPLLCCIAGCAFCGTSIGPKTSARPVSS